MRKPDNQAFSKNFKSVKLFWVPDEDIPKKLVLKSECRRIPKVKSFNSVTAVIDKQRVFIRDSTFSLCDNCLNGNILDCTQAERNGPFKNHVIRKLSGRRKASLAADSSESGDESDSEAEFEDCSEDEESSDEEEEISNVEECTPGRYILFKLTQHKYYVSSIVEYVLP